MTSNGGDTVKNSHSTPLGHSARSGFTLAELVIVVAVIGAVLALVTPWIHWSRQASERTTCARNLRDLGLGVHNYHDAHNELPPLAAGDGHFSWSWFLVESVEACGHLWKAHNDSTKPASAGMNKSDVVEYRMLYQCPSRGIRLTRKGVFAGGQPTDYIAVSTTLSTKWNFDTDGMIVFPKQPPTPKSRARSGITFGDVTDGLSNTAMFGEKHMRAQWLGGPLDQPALVAFEDQRTIRVGGDRVGMRGLANGPDDPDNWKFGGWHPGVTMFVLGDASVRPVQNSITPQVLRHLFSRNDGESFELP